MIRRNWLVAIIFAVVVTISFSNQEEAYTLKFPTIEVKSFLPGQRDSGNAAFNYQKAVERFEQMEQDKALGPALKTKPESLARHLTILKALAEVYDGARIRDCDFTGRFPLTGDWTQGLPNFYALKTLAKLLKENVNFFFSDGNAKTAEEVAKTIIALGHHVRLSAYSLSQEIVGTKIEWQGFLALKDLYALLGRTEELKLCQENIVKIQKTIEIANQKSELLTPSSLTQLIKILNDPEPVIRLEGLILIGGLNNISEQETLGDDKAMIELHSQIKREQEKIKRVVEETHSKDPEPRVRRMAGVVLRKLQ